jgi:DNA repair protein RecN (Recombination protein N)
LERRKPNYEGYVALLSRLHVVHYALIEEVEIEFGQGLNIITGETGAGKSILIGALGLVLGGRASSAVIRTGQSKCIVEAIFDLGGRSGSLDLEAEGIDLDEGELILRRVVSRDGRSRCYANGLSIPVKSLQRIGKLLVDLHGQHDHQSLLDATRHIDFLDGYAGLEKKVVAVAEQHCRLTDIQTRLASLRRQMADQSDRHELLSFQIEEIATAVVQPHEDEALEAERSRLENAERLIESATMLEQMLYQGEDSIVDRIGVAQRTLGEISSADKTLAQKTTMLEAIGYEIEELARFFTGYSQEVEHNPERLAAVVDRLGLLGRLKAKYGGDLDSVLAYAQEAEAEFTGAESNQVEQASLEQELEEVRQVFGRQCFELSESREAASKTLAAAVSESLSELGMPDVTFEIAFSRALDPDGVECHGNAYSAGPSGIETAEFHLSTNPGESARPLVRVASGGEISRIMLALKTVLAQTDSVQVLIFDEIDVGISGRIAEVVGRRLKHLSDGCQTVSITHLPQIAKMADCHFAVRKETDGARTETCVLPLDESERVEELAKLLGGEEISSLTMDHAREMLAARMLEAPKRSRKKQKASA